MANSPNDISRSMYAVRERMLEIESELFRLHQEQETLRLRYNKLQAAMQRVQTRDSSQHSADYIGQVINQIIDI